MAHLTVEQIHKQHIRITNNIQLVNGYPTMLGGISASLTITDFSTSVMTGGCPPYFFRERESGLNIAILTKTRHYIILSLASCEE